MIEGAASGGQMGAVWVVVVAEWLQRQRVSSRGVFVSGRTLLVREVAVKVGLMARSEGVFYGSELVRRAWWRNKSLGWVRSGSSDAVRRELGESRKAVWGGVQRVGFREMRLGGGAGDGQARGWNRRRSCCHAGDCGEAGGERGESRPRQSASCGGWRPGGRRGGVGAGWERSSHQWGRRTPAGQNNCLAGLGGPSGRLAHAA